MRKPCLNLVLLFASAALLQACVAYPVMDAPSYRAREWGGPVYLHAAPVYEVHERGPRLIDVTPSRGRSPEYAPDQRERRHDEDYGGRGRSDQDHWQH